MMTLIYLSLKLTK